MGSHRSLKVALAVGAALLASGTTFAWAGGIVGGHRADQIGTFEPVSQHLVPAGTTPKVAARAPHDPETTSTTVTTTIGNRPDNDPPAAGDDNGRSNDD
jgi:hypothetical protein